MHHLQSSEEPRKVAQNARPSHPQCILYQICLHSPVLSVVPGPLPRTKDTPGTLITQRVTKILEVLFQDLVTKTKIPVSYYESQCHTF